MTYDAEPTDHEDITAAVMAELERASQADHESRLRSLEDLYRSLEGRLDAAGSEVLK